jgi:hypothetical protein
MIIKIIIIAQLLFISAVVFDYEYLFVYYISCAACIYFVHLFKLNYDGVTQYSISLLVSIWVPSPQISIFCFIFRVTFCNFFWAKTCRQSKSMTMAEIIRISIPKMHVITQN